MPVAGERTAARPVREPDERKLMSDTSGVMPLRYRREIGGPSDGAHQNSDVFPTRNGPVVTTIRVTRRPRIPSAGVANTAPRSAPVDGAEGSSIRLALIDSPAAPTTLDGACGPQRGI